MSKEKGRSSRKKAQATVNSTLSSPKPSKIRSLRFILQWILMATVVAGSFHRFYFGLWPFYFDQSAKPANLPKVLNSSQMLPSNSPSLFWGTYRPDLFFGVRHRSPNSLLGGLAWFDQEKLRTSGASRFRHYCRNQEGIGSFGWLANDGEKFGVQAIRDDGFTVVTKWVKAPQSKTGGSWAARIEVIPDEAENATFNSLVSLLFYFTYPGQWMEFMDYSDKENVLEMDGQSPELGRFKISLSRASFVLGEEVRPDRMRCTSYALDQNTNARFGWPIFKHLKKIGSTIKLAANPEHTRKLSSNRAVMFQLDCFEYPCGIYVNFHSIGSEPINNEAHMASLFKDYLVDFDRKFNSTFPQAAQSDTSLLYKYALSNMLGGLGYFYGQAKVQSHIDGTLRQYWPSALFTAVPSRIAFPRGFVWDEAFHHLLLSRWNRQLTLQVLGSYLDLMNQEGWIPREIILGVEAEIHVPAEFIVQHSSHANPPAWLITVDQILRSPVEDGEEEYWSRVGPRLHRWLNWFKTSQVGLLDGSYRWRGRNATTDLELNPKTLTSGLDDYPRASHPDERERHVDLLCWILYSEKVLDGNFPNIKLNKSGIEDLERLHWSGSGFQDYGLHTERVHLRSHEKKIVDDKGQTSVVSTLTRQVFEEPKYQFVPHIGYVSLFPFLLQLLPPDSPYLGTIADHLEDPDVLWSEYGVRSLARNSSLYNKWNTQHDRPYWRGAIWMHFNYLTLRALHHYRKTCESPQLKDRFGALYDRLRENILTNTEKSFRKTHTLWEQYNDVDGEGQFSPSFTGWSALILLIRDELF